MKRKLAASLLVLVLVLVSSMFLPNNGGRVIYGLSSGVYVIRGDAGLASPLVIFDMGDTIADFRFVLSTYPQVSDTAVGKYDIDDGDVILTTDDGRHTYIFEIVDNDIIRFVQEGSDQIVNAAGQSMVADGAEFVYSDELSH